MKKSFLCGFVLCAISLAAFSVGTAAMTLQDGARADMYYRDGARFALEGRLSEAVAAFEQAIALDPKNGNAYYSLGNVYAELGRWADAVAAYRQAISLNKMDVEAYNGLGIALSRRGLYGQSAAAFERANEIYPKWAEPHFHLSQVYRKLGRERAAQVAYNQAIRLRPDYAAHPPGAFMTVDVKENVEARNERAAATGNTVTTSSSGSPKGSSPARGTTPNSNNARA